MSSIRSIIPRNSRSAGLPRMRMTAVTVVVLLLCLHTAVRSSITCPTKRVRTAVQLLLSGVVLHGRDTHNNNNTTATHRNNNNPHLVPLLQAAKLRTKLLVGVHTSRRKERNNRSSNSRKQQQAASSTAYCRVQRLSLLPLLLDAPLALLLLMCTFHWTASHYYDHG